MKDETEKKVIEAFQKIDETTRNTTVKLLPGATFRLLKYNDSQYVIEGTDQEVDATGKLTFTNLPDGEYQIVEITPPNGYIKMQDNDIFIQLKDGVAGVLVEETGSEHYE